MALQHCKQSFSQSGEDLIVDHIFRSRSITKPTYIDVGAYHPWELNNTALFYLKGSRGISIEPDPYLYQNFLTERNLDINLNCGITETKSVSDLYIMNIKTLNTFSREEAKRYEEECGYKIEKVVEREMLTLPYIVDKYLTGKPPDFISIDAEGLDSIILRSMVTHNILPNVICIETITFSDTGKGKKTTEEIDKILNGDYFLYADTNINSIFVKKTFWESEQ